MIGSVTEIGFHPKDNEAPNPSSQFSVEVKSDAFKFSCAHFVAYQGFRERLHGHNYTVEVHLYGKKSDGILNGLSHDGYLIDFGDVKKATKEACNSLNEMLIVPGDSDVLKINKVKNSCSKHNEDSIEYHSIETKNTSCTPKINVKSELLSSSNNIEIICPHDGAFFSFPENDCKILPLVHSTAEELARFLWKDILIRLGGVTYLRDERGVQEMCIFVAERPTQRARYSRPLSIVTDHVNSKEADKSPVSYRDSMVQQSPRRQSDDTTTTGPSSSNGSNAMPNIETITTALRENSVAPQAKKFHQNKEANRKLATLDEGLYPEHLTPIINAYRTILKAVGDDPDRSGIRNTPLRASKTIWELTAGSRMDLSTVVNGALFDIGKDRTSSELDNVEKGFSILSSSSLVIVTDIRIHSTCEHHLLPFFGKVHIAVLPSPSETRRVLGLSKYTRICEMFAKRLQVQERLTDQICQGIWDAYSLNFKNTDCISGDVASHPSEDNQPGCLGVAVLMTDCQHLCMSCRGVQQQQARTYTSAYKGAFQDVGSKEDKVRAIQLRTEFMGHLTISGAGVRQHY